VIGGWQTNAIVTVDGGTPFDINTSGVNNAGIDNRADVLQFQHVALGAVGGTTVANHLTYFSGTFAPPPTISVGGNLVYTRAGNVQRNQFYGPGFTAVDFGIFKDFAITERVKFQFRAQAYNLLNTPAFTNPDGDIHDGVANANGTYTTGAASNGFGSISGTRAQSQRQLELAARINF
jgi:hypothetical protein